MLLIISSIIIIIIFLPLFKRYCDKDNFLGELLSIIMIIISFVTLIANVGSTVNAAINKNAYESAWRAEYNAIIEQIDNHAYSLFDRDALIIRATEWNKKIAEGQAKHNSLWTNWMYLEDYDSFELIDIGKIK